MKASEFWDTIGMSSESPFVSADLLARPWLVRRHHPGS